MENETAKLRIQTIVLCGGIGTRLREETEFKPKPMVEVGDKPILWHIMKIYSHYGYSDFILALGYKGNTIKDYFLKEKQHTHDFSFNVNEGKVTNFFRNGTTEDNFNIIFGETGLETPHGERVLKLKKYITEDIFMVTYGDGVADIDIEKLIAFHKSHERIATITGVHPVSRWGLVNTDQDQLVTEFAEKPMLHDYVNGGFMVFNKEFFKYLKPREMIEESLVRLILDKELSVYIHDGFWSAMDTYQDVEEMNKQWKKDPLWRVW